MKTLIISSWAPPMVGGPQNLYNLFSCMPKEKYDIVTSYHATHGEQSGMTKGTTLPCTYFYFDNVGPLHSLKLEATKVAPTPSFKTQIYKTISIIPLLGGLMTRSAAYYVGVRQFTSAAIAAARTSNATHLLGISDMGPALLTTYLAHRKTRLPYTIYLFDLYRGNLLPQPYKLIANIMERRILCSAKNVILTNEETEAYYKRRYGGAIRTSVIHNSNFPENFPSHEIDTHQKAPFTITFTGNIYWAQEQAVLNLVQAMDFLKDIPILLKLYCPKPSEKILRAVTNKKNIWLGAALQAQMPKIQSDATLLYLPLAWNTKAPDIIATATPGKFTDYLAAGRPILIHAPDYAYVSKYARKYELGLVVDQNDPKALSEAIRKFLSNPVDGARYVKNALRIFHKNHDARKNAKKLTEIFSMV